LNHWEKPWVPRNLLESVSRSNHLKAIHLSLFLRSLTMDPALLF
jgi:hypothetical protein